MSKPGLVMGGRGGGGGLWAMGDRALWCCGDGSIDVGAQSTLT